MASTDHGLLGIVTATAKEAQIFKRAVSKQTNYVLQVSGIGAENALAASNGLIRQRVTHLLSFGFAGALDPAIPGGTVIIPNTICTEDKKHYNVSPVWFEAITSTLNDSVYFNTSPLLQTSYIVMNPDEKSRLFAATNAGSVDMESGAVATAGYQARTPTLVIRAISDEANDTLPHLVRLMVQPDCNWRKLGLDLVKHPNDLRHLPKLLRNYRRALKSLTSVVQCTSSSLCAW